MKVPWRPQDAGTYICNVQNDMGKYEHTTSLVVGGKALHKKVYVSLSLLIVII